MNINCNITVEAWLGQIVVTGCEVGNFLITKTMPAIKLYPVQVFVSNKISTPGVEGGVTMRIFLVFEELVSSFNPVQMHLKTCYEISVVELIGDSCSRQFKLPVLH